MKIGHVIFFALMVAVSSAYVENHKNANSARFFNSRPKPKPFLRTLSLSVVGDFSFARIVNFSKNYLKEFPNVSKNNITLEANLS